MVVGGHKRTGNQRRAVAILSFLIIGLVMIWIVIRMQIIIRRSRFKDTHGKWTPDEQMCRPPTHIDPNDPIISSFLRHEITASSFKCPEQKPLTMLDQETGVVSYLENDSYSCHYSFFRRKDEADNHMVYEATKKFHPNVTVTMTNQKNLLNTSCTDKFGNKFYINTHLFVPSLKSLIPNSTASSPDKPSVLIIFLESLSQLSFTRFMKRSKESLDGMGNVHYFKYFVKAMDNSFPNSMALLTGKRIPWSEEVKLENEFFDGKFRYLWDDFKDAGYVTSFEEDMAIIGLFNYAKMGFRNPLCDFNPRSYWVQMYPEKGDFSISKSLNDPDDYCFHQNGPKIRLFLDHVKLFIEKNRDIPYFSYYFYSQMTHEDINNYKLVDPFFADFYRDIKPLMNNTILIFAGDHGFRMSKFVPTSMGRIEERMNLVTIRIPDAVDEKFPHPLKKRMITTTRWLKTPS